jgi:hypothetical protein
MRSQYLLCLNLTWIPYALVVARIRVPTAVRARVRAERSRPPGVKDQKNSFIPVCIGSVQRPSTDVGPHLPRRDRANYMRLPFRADGSDRTRVRDRSRAGLKRFNRAGRPGVVELGHPEFIESISYVDSTHVRSTASRSARCRAVRSALARFDSSRVRFLP